MTRVLLSSGMVEAIHEAALNPGEPSGRSSSGSLEGALERIENRVAYGLMGDAFDLAAAYGFAVGWGHYFKKANRRTALQCIDTVLVLNGTKANWSAEEIGDTIIRVSKGKLDESSLADWLREKA